ncbi:MAG TPA: galactose mutarotase [Bacteroides sp.]|nr:galactose mutarotase [Bacteroides sp.]
MKQIPKLFILLLLLAGSSCKNSKSGKSQQENLPEEGWYLDAEKFRSTIDGKETDLYRLSNESGMEVYVTNYGAVIPALLVPDRDGNHGDIVLGFDNVERYTADGDPNFGNVPGRYANRIDGGKFELDGTVYELPINDTRNQNQLHGGTEGFMEQVWETIEATENSVELKLVSPDGQMGYPGTVTVYVRYTVTVDNTLEIDYKATTDAPTVLNVTQHSYFNLKGEGNGNILDHKIMLNADSYTPVNERMIPTGEVLSVEGTPMDFRTPTKIGERIDSDFDQLVMGNGYDHNWVINSEGGLAVAATAYDETTGRFMEVLTTEPGVQLYCGNFLDGTLASKSGGIYEHRGGFCLETQHYPDSPNHPNFPSTVLRPGEEFNSKTVFKFYVK